MAFYGPRFGGGLFTTFEYADLEIERTGPEMATLRFNIANTGELAGDEVIQLYVHDEYSSVVRPLKELKAFKRFSLEPGETRSIEIELASDAFAFYDVGTQAWRVEPGLFELMVGCSSEDIRLRGILDLTEPVPFAILVHNIR